MNEIMDFSSLKLIRTISPNDEMYYFTALAAQSIALRPKAASDVGITLISHTADIGPNPGTAITTHKPVGLQTGDLLIAVIASSFCYQGVTTPPGCGWVKLLNTSSVAAIVQLDTYYKVVDGNEPASWIWQLDNINARSTGSITAYRGVDTTDPVVATSGNSCAREVNPSAPAITTDAANCMVLGIFSAGKANGSFIPPSGFNEVVNITCSDPNFGNYHMVCEKIFVSMGTTGDLIAISTADQWNDQYFRIGASALRQVVLAMIATDKKDCRSILDLPCGHGRVLRHIRARFPNASITACDLDRDAVDFCANTFGAKGIYSQDNIHEVSIDEKFDLIWCGSLFTHLDRDQWFEFLEFFSNHLEEDGLLIFTTHGRFPVNKLYQRERDYGLDRLQVSAILNEYKRTGFGYLNYPSKDDYGISISAPSWVLSEIQRHPQLRIVSFEEMGWDYHHDVAVCARSAENFPVDACCPPT